MTKRRRKVKPEDPFGFITKHERNASGVVEYANTPYDRIAVNIRGMSSFMDHEETFQAIRAMARVGACQFGEDWLERVTRYLTSIHVVREPVND